jgi:hypothetical protein
MKQSIILAAIIGFAVPIFWGVLGFAFFTAPQSNWTDLYWAAVHVSCPFWVLPLPTILIPFLNAGLYGLIAFVIGKVRVGQAVAS